MADAAAGEGELGDQELVTRYFAQMRREVFVPGMRTECLDELTRCADERSREALIIWHRFAEADAERIVARELAHFASAQTLTWKVYADDVPANLPRLLREAGLDAKPHSALMVANVRALCAHDIPPAAVQIRQLNQRDDIALLRAVWDSVWPGEAAGWLDILGEALEVHPSRLKIVVACVESQPVSSGYIIFDPHSDFAYLGGGATIEAHRGRGHYRTLVTARAALALAANVSYLAVEASSESRPVLDRLGFRQLTTVQFFERTASSQGADTLAP